MYVLDTPSMLDNGYPIPSYLGEGLALDPESVRSTSSWPAAAPTPQTRENGWVETPPSNPTSEIEAPKIIAIDCEMVRVNHLTFLGIFNEILSARQKTARCLLESVRLTTERKKSYMTSWWFPISLS